MYLINELVLSWCVKGALTGNPILRSDEPKSYSLFSVTSPLASSVCPKTTDIIALSARSISVPAWSRIASSSAGTRRCVAKSISNSFNHCPFQTCKYKHPMVATSSILSHYSFLITFFHRPFAEDSIPPSRLADYPFLSYACITLFHHLGKCVPP